MKKLMYFVLLMVLVMTAPAASAQSSKKPMDVEFNSFVDKLIDMKAICKSDISEYEGGYHKFYVFVLDKKDLKLITNFETKCIYPKISSAYQSDICKTESTATLRSIGYGKNNTKTYNLGGFKDRNYDILFIRDPVNKEKRYVYALVWWQKGGKINGNLLKFYNFDPVIQREKSTDSTNSKVRIIHPEDNTLTYIDRDSGKRWRITDTGFDADSLKNTSSSVLTAVSSICTAYISLVFSDKKSDKTKAQRLILAGRLVTLCNKGRDILTNSDRKTCLKLIENIRTSETDTTNDTMLGAAITLLKNN